MSTMDNPSVELPELGNSTAPFTQGSLKKKSRRCVMQRRLFAKGIKRKER